MQQIAAQKKLMPSAGLNHAEPPRNVYVSTKIRFKIKGNQSKAYNFKRSDLAMKPAFMRDDAFSDDSN
jgi:hypothetical protein